MGKKPSDILELIKKHGVKMVDFRFVDVPGTWQHTSVPAAAVDEHTLEAGIGFDGSTIAGFQSIDESDMIMKPDLETACLDSFRSETTLSLTCDIFDPAKQAWYEKDPRRIAKSAEAYLKSTGIGDTAYFGPEAEFFIFDSVAYENEPHSAGYALDAELRRNYPVAPADRMMDLRSEIALELAGCGISVEIHHDVATAGQTEIDIRYDSLLKTADNVMKCKYVVKSVCARNGKVATFMPKPLLGDNGSGMHVHQSLWKDGKPLFFDANGYGECSQLMLYYIGGLLTHIGSVLAFAAPTTNSYKRLVPHTVRVPRAPSEGRVPRARSEGRVPRAPSEVRVPRAPCDQAPVNVAFSARNRSAAIRIPMFFKGNAKAKRLEFRPPDPSSNPYLAFSAMLLAGLDGIKRQIDPVKAGFGPLDANIYELPPDEAAKVQTVPRSLGESLDALAGDREYLLAGGVFSSSFIDEWIEYKHERELKAVDIRPHPYEFHLYFDI
jgi:glutamine synthetase